MVPFRAGTSCSNFCLIYPFRTCGGCLNQALQSWTGAAPLAKEPLSSLGSSRIVKFLAWTLPGSP